MSIVKALKAEIAILDRKINLLRKTLAEFGEVDEFHKKRKMGGARKLWSDEDVAYLVKSRENGLSWDVMGRTLNRTAVACQVRWSVANAAARKRSKLKKVSG